MPTRTALRTRLAPLALGLAAAALLLTRPAAADGPSFSLAPIRLEIAPKPGRPYTEALEVTNESRESAHLKVYTEDWRLERDGAVTFARAGTWPRSASGWVRINPVEFDLPPQATVDIRFTVTVPAGAPAGGYRTAIVVEQVPRPTPGRTPVREVAIRARIASVLYVRVGEPVPSMALHDVRFRREPNGMRSLVVAVQNTSSVHFRVRGQIELADPASGKRLYRVPVPDVPVLPESPRDVRVPLPDTVKPGTYHARTEIDIGRPELYVHDGVIRID
ncbi:MAG TPA: hypothetical protein VNM66_00765 [Thermodesulfobacteriota bacterium]|nr:hypothetical protein [Thermodesulfobacteriota bacterium]